MVVHLRQNFDVLKCFVIPLRESIMACDNVFDDKNRLENRVVMHGRQLLHFLNGLDSSEVFFILLKLKT